MVERVAEGEVEAGVTRRRRRGGPIVAGPAARTIVVRGHVAVEGRFIGDRLHSPHDIGCGATTTRIRPEIGGVEGQQFVLARQAAGVAALCCVVAGSRGGIGLRIS